MKLRVILSQQRVASQSDDMAVLRGRLPLFSNVATMDATLKACHSEQECWAIGQWENYPIIFRCICGFLSAAWLSTDYIS